MRDRLRLARRAQTFGHAFRGIGSMIRTEYNARAHLLAAALVVAGGLVLEIDRFEWMILVLTISSVLSLEAVNTAIEALCDAVHPEQHPGIGRAKDVAAGAVLIAALGAVVIALLIFGRRLVG